MSTSELPIRKWVTDKYLSEYYGVSRMTIWRWSRNGKLPAPVKIGENTTRWNFEQIQASESTV